MRTERLGENAIILVDLDRPANLVAAAIRLTLPDLLDVVPAYGSVGIYFDEPPALDRIAQAMEAEPSVAEPPKLHKIPVCYQMAEDGPDVCERLGLSLGELIELHSAETYHCAAVGFKPGFAYLGDLNSRIATLPRKPTPRLRVRPGSVAITGRQTAVYPVESPGGWWLIGRTPLQLVDVSDDYFPISAGDAVQFYPIDEKRYVDMEGARL